MPVTKWFSRFHKVSLTETESRSGRERRTKTWSGWKTRPCLDRLKTDAPGHRGLGVAGRVRGVEVATRGRAADRRADGGCLVSDARSVGARSRGAGYQADGEAALGNSRSGVYLFDLKPGLVDGDRAFLGRPGRGEEHRTAEPKAIGEYGPDSAGRPPAVGKASLDRRRADSGADVLEQALRRFRAAAHRGTG